MSELKGFTLMFRMELLVRDHTLVLCLKAALTYSTERKKTITPLDPIAKWNSAVGCVDSPTGLNTKITQLSLKHECNMFITIPQSWEDSETRRQRTPKEKAKESKL